MTLIDCSHYQGDINWAATDPVIDGAYIKTTEGTAYVDPKWSSYYDGARGGGKPAGAYHFADGADPTAEANHFADTYLQRSWQLRPVLDAEITKITPAWIRSFRAVFRARVGHAAFRVYSSLSLLQGQLNPAGWLDADTDLWVAAYRATLGWNHPSLVLWQNTSAAHLPGILGTVDTDQFMNGWTPARDFAPPPEAGRRQQHFLLANG